MESEIFSQVECDACKFFAVGWRAKSHTRSPDNTRRNTSIVQRVGRGVGDASSCGHVLRYDGDTESTLGSCSITAGRISHLGINMHTPSNEGVFERFSGAERTSRVLRVS